MCGFVLCAASLLKFASAATDGPSMLGLDFVTGLQNRWLAILAASFEFGVGLYCFLGPSLRTQILLVWWITLLFTAYRLGSLWSQGRTLCPCIGGVLTWWPWLQRHREVVATGLFFYLVATSVAGVVVLLLKDKLRRNVGQESRGAGIVEPKTIWRAGQGGF
jgi:hypothetical protein